MERFIEASAHRVPWNKGKLVGQKSPLRLKGNLGYPDTAAAF